MKKLLVKFHHKTLLFRDLVWLIVPAIILISLPLIMWAVLNERIELRGRASSTTPGYTTITWHTPDVALVADQFYVFADNLFFYTNAQNANLHSDPANAGENTTTMEAIWYENDREMRVNIYFEKDATSWWITEFRSYNGKTENPDWIYYPHIQDQEKTPLGRARSVNLSLISGEDNMYYGKLNFGNLTVMPFLRELSCFHEVLDGAIPSWPDGCRGFHPPGIMCTQAITPLNAEELASFNDWKAVGSPTLPCYVPPPPVEPCTPLPDCYYTVPQCLIRPEPGVVLCPPEVTDCRGETDGIECVIVNSCSEDTDCEPTVDHGVCRQNVCDTTADEPTVTSTPIPTAIIVPACLPGTPSLEIPVQEKTGSPGEGLTYLITLTNTDSASCGSSAFGFSAESPAGWLVALPVNIELAPGAKKTFPVSVTSPANAPAGTQEIYLEINSNSGSPYHFVRVPLYYKVTGSTAGALSFRFRFKFDGVAGNKAFTNNAGVKIHLVTPDSNLITPRLPVTYTTNGVYTASFTVQTPLLAGQKVYFLIKGDKHAAMKVCEAAQTGPCLPTSPQWLTVPAGLTNNFWEIDYTKIPLLAGDTDQNYIVNTVDFQTIRSLLNKSPSELTQEELSRTDLNYDGIIDIRDLFLIQKTLENRYDPN